MNTKLIRLDFKGMRDIIILPEPDEMVRIWTIINEHGFCFEKFTLVTPLATFKVHIDGLNDDQIIHVKVIYKKLDGLSKTEKYDLTIKDYFEKYADLTRNFLANGYKAAKGNDTVDLIIPFHFMQYLVYSDLHRTIEYIEPSERKPGNKTHSNAKSGTQELSLTDCIRIYHTTNKNRQYTRRTEQWERRGGIRRLKSGKLVPYKAATCHAKDKPIDNNENNTRFYRL